MKEKIPEGLLRLCEKLNKPLYVVGGSCRDYIAGLVQSGSDWDICAAAGAEEACLAAKSAGLKADAVYARTGTVRISDGGNIYEYTCFRTDKYVRGVHSPEEVYFTEDISLDAKRRDFKCNAIYYDIKSEKFVDPLGGIEDARRAVISTVKEAEKVFGEDGLRLMRLCRIAAQTGFTPTEECLEGAKSNSHLICDIAAERVRAELEMILCADKKYGVQYGQYKGLEMLKDIGVLAYILPELSAGDKMEQRSDFHSYDVLEHTLRCVKYADYSIRLAALLHDVGKPFCKDKRGTFAGHEQEGARIARDILLRLRFPKKIIDRVGELVKYHMYDFSCLASENKVRKFLTLHGDIADDLLLLKQADFSACKDDLSPAPCVVKWQNIIQKMQSEGVPRSLKDLDVKGDELIAAGLDRSDVGKALEFLLCECAIDKSNNQKARLVKIALSRYKKS